MQKFLQRRIDPLGISERGKIDQRVNLPLEGGRCGQRRSSFVLPLCLASISASPR